jgi:NAD(P)-dependent dehydrogenase (short-subunit alcohol dehydrogenase family)
VSRPAALVTGAGSGIGLALAHALAARGMDLGLADIDAEALESAREALQAAGCRVECRTVNVADEAQVQAAAGHFATTLGPVRYLFNNAGIDVSGELAWLSMADWHRAFDVNVFGVVHGLRHFLPLLQRHGGPAHVLNTASGAGFWVNGQVRMGAYAATKSAVVAISEALEQELAGSPVRVSVLCPGPVATAIAERSGKVAPGLREAIAQGVQPDFVARIALEAMERGEFYIFTPNRMAAGLQQRHLRIQEALARAAVQQHGVRAAGRPPAASAALRA